MEQQEYDRLKRCVVCIEVHTGYIFDVNGYETAITMVGGGVFIEENGLILTCAHLFEKQKKIFFRCSSNPKLVEAKIVDIDYSRDIALITPKHEFNVTDHDSEVGFLSTATLVQVGSRVVTVSHPMGLLYSYSIGQIGYPSDFSKEVDSTIDVINCNRAYRIPKDFVNEELDVELLSYPKNLPLLQIHNHHGNIGSSGCPVFDSSGHVIGIIIFTKCQFDFAHPARSLSTFISTYKMRMEDGDDMAEERKGKEIDRKGKKKKMGKSRSRSRSYKRMKARENTKGEGGSSSKSHVLAATTLAFNCDVISATSQDGQATSLLGPTWTEFPLLQSTFPKSIGCHWDRHLTVESSVLIFTLNRDVAQSLANEVLTTALSDKGPKEVLTFLKTLQPSLIENPNIGNFSIWLEDLPFPVVVILVIEHDLQECAALLRYLRYVYDGVLKKRVVSDLKLVIPASSFILKSFAMGTLIDFKGDSSMNKVVQQIGFLGMQLSDQGKFYTRTLVTLVKSGFFHGFDRYKMVRSIFSRKLLSSSSRGLTEPGTLLKNLMTIPRDVVIVRNVSSNSIVQFEYGGKKGSKPQSLSKAGEPVGVLAATAKSNLAYKAVLVSSPSSSFSWELMKEVLFCCGRKHCQALAAFLVENKFKKVALKYVAVEFRIEYEGLQVLSEMNARLTRHIHLNKDVLDKFNMSMHDVYNKCEEAISSLTKIKSGSVVKMIMLSISQCCSFQQPAGSKWSRNPCLTFFWQDGDDTSLAKTSNILADIIHPVLLQTIMKGDPLISSVNINLIVPETKTRIQNPCKNQKGELVLNVVLEESAVIQSDAWRTMLISRLPVLDVLDTNSSLPFKIKQVQELLGLSCSFEKAVQLLPTSVVMVTRGVLKEHQNLLANSKTCAGNLVGFNIGGHKALSLSLVPFTEATLYTPIKYFERAVVKCHMDKLSSIAASCSWGGYVTVGTDSRFELLWNTKEIAPQKAATDVYKLLHLARKVPNGVLSDTGCLGADVNAMEVDDENQDICPSPEQNSDFAKAVFENDAEVRHSGFLLADDVTANESTWDMVTSGNADSTGGGGWDVEKKPKMGGAASSKNDDWSGQGSVKSNAHANLPFKQPEKCSSTAGWDDAAIKKGQTDAEPLSDWAKKRDGAQNGFSQVDTAGWGDRTMQKETLHSGTSPGWGKKVDVAGKFKSEYNNCRDWDTSTKSTKPAADSHAWDASRAGGRNQIESQPQWGKKTGVTCNKNHSESSAGWDDWAFAKRPADWVTPDDWSAKVDKTGKDTRNTGGWGNSNKPNQSASSHVWYAPRAEGVNENETQPHWGQQTGITSTKDQSATGWNDTDVQKGSINSEATAGWSTKVEEAGNAETGWGSPKAVGWGTSSEHSTKPGNFATWDSTRVGGVNENEKPSQWEPLDGLCSKKERPNNSQGWTLFGGGGGDWKIKKNHPARTPGVTNENSNAGGAYTPRPPSDRYKIEEQPIFQVVAMVKSIKRIMNLSGRYNDGDKLIDEDLNYVLETVSVHYPDKYMKMGSEIDHFTSKFQDTRCFYVVLTDGNAEDFFSRKCAENFVRGKDPAEQHAESFVNKYSNKYSSGVPKSKILWGLEIQWMPRILWKPETSNLDEQYNCRSLSFLMHNLIL